LVKKHRNKCLFVFTYNIDNPGFAYDILSQVQDFVITMPLKEGTGDRKTAIKYLQSLIKDSQYAEYANQAEEFMEQYVSDKFTQTDVLMAFEKFEPWCVNKNIMKAYDNVFSKEFMLDRDENALSAYDRLQKLVGLEHVKCRIDDIIKAHSIEVVRKKLLGNNYQAGTMHMIMSGNPGTGKTEVARLLAGIAKEKDILKSGAFVATSGPALNGGDIKDEVPNAFKAATDGVLFIDEAYAMLPSTATILIQELEEHRDDVIVILAGYEESMKGFLDLNDGIKSRIPHWIEFPDYTLEELVDIFKMMADSRRFSYDDAVINEVRSVLDKERFIENFGNARAVRNLLDDVIKKQSVRLAEQKDDSDDIDKTKLWTITVEDITTLDEYKAQKKSDKTAREQLEELIGQEKVKEVIYKAIANIKMKKEKLDRGIRVDNASYHMVFTGNPGVAKTTIARLLAEILKDENVLPTGNFVEAGRADLVAAVVGATAPKVKQRFKEARGGVLFIDEAYALCDSHNNSFGDEAIATIVQEMENHREDTIVVFAGYTEQMKDFLDRNPGMASRIAFNIEFDDYTTDELCDITRIILSNRDMNITDEAMDKLRDNYEVARKSNDYGNGRYVRKMLEEAEMNISSRLFKEPARITDELLTTIEVDDIPEIDFNKMNRSATVGFSTI
ncbi:MAG: AAA family ATPase, partial [Lachnospiraceae bacterium]|nr:AAA family ATPase [Lachnospiraceae bacterium]